MGDPTYWVSGTGPSGYRSDNAWAHTQATRAQANHARYEAEDNANRLEARATSHKSNRTLSRRTGGVKSLRRHIRAASAQEYQRVVREGLEILKETLTTPTPIRRIDGKLNSQGRRLARRAAIAAGLRKAWLPKRTRCPDIAQLLNDLGMFVKVLVPSDNGLDYRPDKRYLRFGRAKALVICREVTLDLDYFSRRKTVLNKLHAKMKAVTSRPSAIHNTKLNHTLWLRRRGLGPTPYNLDSTRKDYERDLLREGIEPNPGPFNVDQARVYLEMFIKDGSEATPYLYMAYIGYCSLHSVVPKLSEFLSTRAKHPPTSAHIHEMKRLFPSWEATSKMQLRLVDSKPVGFFASLFAPATETVAPPVPAPTVKPVALLPPAPTAEPVVAPQRAPTLKPAALVVKGQPQYNTNAPAPTKKPVAAPLPAPTARPVVIMPWLTRAPSPEPVAAPLPAPSVKPVQDKEKQLSSAPKRPASVRLDIVSPPLVVSRVYFTPDRRRCVTAVVSSVRPLPPLLLAPTKEPVEMSDSPAPTMKTVDPVPGSHLSTRTERWGGNVDFVDSWGRRHRAPADPLSFLPSRPSKSKRRAERRKRMALRRRMAGPEPVELVFRDKSVPGFWQIPSRGQISVVGRTIIRPLARPYRLSWAELLTEVPEHLKSIPISPGWELTSRPIPAASRRRSRRRPRPTYSWAPTGRTISGKAVTPTASK